MSDRVRRLNDHIFFDVCEHACANARRALEPQLALLPPQQQAALLLRCAYEMALAASVSCAILNDKIDIKTITHPFDHPETLCIWRVILDAWSQAPDREAMDRVMAAGLNAEPVLPPEDVGGRDV